MPLEARFFYSYALKRVKFLWCGCMFSTICTKNLNFNLIAKTIIIGAIIIISDSLLRIPYFNLNRITTVLYHPNKNNATHSREECRVWQQQNNMIIIYHHSYHVMQSPEQAPSILLLLLFRLHTLPAHYFLYDKQSINNST